MSIYVKAIKATDFLILWQWCMYIFMVLFFLTVYFSTQISLTTEKVVLFCFSFLVKSYKVI